MRAKLRLVLAILAFIALILVSAWWLYFSPSSPYWRGSYIPRDLDDAHVTLLRDLPASEIEKIKGFRSEDDMIEYHMGMGLGMRNGWGLWSGSRLAHYFNGMGIYAPDDMSAIILSTFWCRLHNQPFRLNERVAFYQAYWKAAADPPETAVSPDGHKIDWVQSWMKGTKNMPREIHVGVDTANGTFWAYEYDKGVYMPPPEMMEEIKKDDYWKTTYPELIKEKKQAGIDPPAK